MRYTLFIVIKYPNYVPCNTIRIITYYFTEVMIELTVEMRMESQACNVVYKITDLISRAKNQLGSVRCVIKSQGQ